MLKYEFSYPFYLMPDGHATWCTQVQKYGRSSRRWLGVSASLQLLQASTFIAECAYHIVSSAEREHGNAEDRFAITVKEHNDTSWQECWWQTYSLTPTTRGRPNLSAVSSTYNILIRSNCTRTCHMRNLFAFYLLVTPNDHINNYFWPFE